ncbi:MAG: hypothetical protein QOE53_360, partial [Pseudonocardiales bacterium]|nr:hypothetical protein [Pseudonocardiales bacterium]
LQFSRLTGPLLMQACQFVEPLNLSKMLLVDVDLSGSWLPGLDIFGADIQHNLTLRSVRVTGRTQLQNITTGGYLDLNGGNFTNPDGEAVNADQARINGGVYLGAGFHAEGHVRLLGARIGSQLDLSGGTFNNPNGNAISADGVRIEGDVFCGSGFHAHGEVRLLGAAISGDLDLSGGTFSNPNGDAISADRALIDGSVFCSKGFKAEGEIRLLGVTVGGQLDLSGGTFSAPTGAAVIAERARITGNLVCGQGFRSYGEIRLLGATIGGQLDLRAGSFNNPNGRAITADSTRIEGGIFCSQGFRANGETRLLGATIGKRLLLTGGIFSNPNGNAISADGAQIEGHMHCGAGFYANGETSLVGATISGYFELSGSTFSNPNGNAISADRARIGTLTFLKINAGSAGSISLGGAHAGYLRDDIESWQRFSEVSLLNFTYDRITDDGWSPGSRLPWLERDPEYRAQPYEQLAQTLRAQGHEREAREVMVAKNRRRRRQLSRWRRLPEYLFDWLLVYGYHPLQRTLPALALLYFLGALLIFPNARDHHAIIATRASIHQTTTPAGTTTGGSATTPPTGAPQRPVTATAKCPSDYPCFSPWAFTADALIPLINTHQTDFWAVSGSTRVGFWTTLYSWLASAFGWVLTTAAALGFTGLIRRD